MSTTNKKGKVVKTVYAEIFAAEGSNDDSFVFALFPGADKPTEITDITVADYKIRQNAIWDATKGPIFKGNVNGAEIKLLKSVRKGQESLVIQLFPKTGPKKQLTEIVTEKLGDDVADRKQKACIIGKEICVAIIEGKVEFENVNSFRDDLMRKHGASPRPCEPKAKRLKSAAASSFEPAAPDPHVSSDPDGDATLMMWKKAVAELDDI